LIGWRRVVDRVHAAGCAMFAQLWHVGMQRDAKVVELSGRLSASPSGHDLQGQPVSAAMTQRDIDATIDAYARAAQSARDAGFDGVELHGAHGYLIDQFFWEGTNRRTDAYGGDILGRTRFACEAIAEIKRRLGTDFPVSIRLSQWKQQDLSAVLARSPGEWQEFLAPLVDAGIDVFHISTRRYGDPAFPGSDASLAALTRRMTGRVVITVGSVGLSKAKEAGWERGTDWSIAPEQNLDDIEHRLSRGDFDLVAVGRALLANPEWARLVEQGRFEELKPYTLEARNKLY
jgi:2,4-dienoyl-CoA reductase-like NADH-dependent reductase (Old Yellow Enzyme family)